MGCKRIMAAALVTCWVAPALGQEDTVAPAKSPFAVSAETTRVSGPVRGDGTIDYVEALNELRLKDTTVANVAATLARVLGKEAWPEPVRNRVFEKLGVEAGADDATFVPLKKWLPKQESGEGGMSVSKKLEQANDWLAAASESPWKKDGSPDLAAWLGAQDRALDAVSEALAQSTRCAFPAVSSNPSKTYAGMVTPPLADLMSLGQALVVRAMNRLDAQEYAGCWSDLRAAHRLARCVGQGNNVIERLVAYQIEHVAWVGSTELLRDERMSAEGYKGMVKDLEAMGAMTGIGACLNQGERFLGLDSVMLAVRSGKGATNDAAAAALTAVKWDDVLKDMNKLYDDAVAAVERPTRAERVKATAAFDAMTRTLKPGDDARPELTVRLSGTLRSYVAPSLTTLLQHSEASATEDSLLLVGAAMAAYRAEQGKYPASPTDLTPDYVKAIPTDRYSDNLLQYKATTRGYVLYSVGPDGVDDEGREIQRGKGDVVLKVRGR